MSLYDENEKNDFFEDTDIPEKPAKQPKKPALTPDDPRYWDEPEDEFEHLKPSPRTHWKFWLALVGTAIVIGILWGIYNRLFTPRIEDATQYGYIESLEKHNGLFDTFEGVILPYKNLMDTTRVYEGDFVFSTHDPAVAALLKKMQFANKPVRVSYSVYHTVMPWRGESKVVVVQADSVDERNILPPDRQPETIKQSANEE